MKRVFWFWLPLAAMWLMMAAELPLITAAVARLPEARENLAAFGLTYALSLIIESPVIMLMTAATALAGSRGAYRRLLRFTHVLAAALTAIHLLLALTPLYGWIVVHVIGAPPELAVLGRLTFLIMAPWSAAIAYRRLWQGVLIRTRRTLVVPLTLISRLVVILGILLFGVRLRWLPGAYLGAAALSCGVIVAAFTALAFVRPVIRRLPAGPARGPHGGTAPAATVPLATAGQHELPWGVLLAFYAPLALTTLLNLSSQPVLSAGLARAPDPLGSLAVWPVITGFLFVIRALGLSFQEAVVVLAEDRRSFLALRRFGWVLVAVCALVLGVFSFSSLRELWFSRVAGLGPELTELTRVPLRILIAIPVLDTVLAWLRGLRVRARRTAVISQAVGVNLVVLTVTMFVGAAVFPLPGVVIAALAYALAFVAEAAFLRWRQGGSGLELVVASRGVGYTEGSREAGIPGPTRRRRLWESRR